MPHCVHAPGLCWPSLLAAPVYTLLPIERLRCKQPLPPIKAASRNTRRSRKCKNHRKGKEIARMRGCSSHHSSARRSKAQNRWLPTQAAASSAQPPSRAARSLLPSAVLGRATSLPPSTGSALPTRSLPPEPCRHYPEVRRRYWHAAGASAVLGSVGPQTSLLSARCLLTTPRGEGWAGHGGGGSCDVTACVPTFSPAQQPYCRPWSPPH